MGTPLLIIDDDPDFHAFMDDLLDPLDLTVLHAQRVHEGITIILTQQPALVIMDLHMPDLDGAEVIRELKKSALKEMPVIAMTGSTATYDYHHAVDAGCDDYVPKTTPPSEIRALISKYVTSG